MIDSLIDAFGIRHGDLAAFVGGGGKSTLTLRLGRELAERHHPVVLTTTTRMGSSQIPDWCTPCRSIADVRRALERGIPPFLLSSIDGHKVVGVAPGDVDAVGTETDATVLVEADGARRRPFKAPGPNEPVIPSTASLVVVVVGADAIGGKIADVCHRPERVAALVGGTVDDRVRPEDVALVVTHPAGGLRSVPDGARHVVALTKVDDSLTAAARRIGDLIAPTRLVTVPTGLRC